MLISYPDLTLLSDRGRSVFETRLKIRNLAKKIKRGNGAKLKQVVIPSLLEDVGVAMGTAAIDLCSCFKMAN